MPSFVGLLDGYLTWANVVIAEKRGHAPQRHDARPRAPPATQHPTPRPTNHSTATRTTDPWQHDGSAHQQPNATDPPPATTRHNATSSAHAAPPSPRNPAATTSRNHERNAGNDEPGTPPTGRNGFPSADPRQPAHDRPTYHTDPSPGRNPRTDTTDTEPTDTAHLLTKERKPRPTKPPPDASLAHPGVKVSINTAQV